MFATPQFALPSLHDPLYTTSKIAKAVILDLNDPFLLIDADRVDVSHNTHQSKAGFTRNGRAAFSKGLSQRYNISNDEAYDLLKENHQSKVRSTLGNLAVSHGMPALRLQWPYVSHAIYNYTLIRNLIVLIYLVQNKIRKARSSILPPPRNVFSAK